MSLSLSSLLPLLLRKKKGGNKEVEEVKPEEMAVRIGGTVLTERRGAISGNHMINVTCDGVCVCVCVCVCVWYRKGSN